MERPKSAKWRLVHFNDNARATNARMATTLARWLGPWTNDERVPKDVARWSVQVGEFEAWVYSYKQSRGALLLVPGLHYAGPKDPRLDRFARVLARAGILVLCPFLPDFGKLLVGRNLPGDVERSYDALLELPDLPNVVPGVMSISFGSWPALALAAKRDVGGLLLFGGYSDFRETMRFSIAGQDGRPHDPLNQPVVFLNLLPHLELPDGDREPLAAAWRTYVEQTWGQQEMKERARHEPVARAIAETLPEPWRTPFARGVGLEEDGLGWAEDALARAGDAFDHLDPLPHCRQVQIEPMTVVHGRDDDVIPWTHAERLGSSLPPWARTYVTGLYAHTGGANVLTLAGQIPSAVEEFRKMVGIVRAMVSTSRKICTPKLT